MDGPSGFPDNAMYGVRIRAPRSLPRAQGAFVGADGRDVRKSRIQEGLSSAGSGSVAAGVRASSELSLIKVGGFVVVRMG